MALYVVMALAAFVMIWANLQYKSKGVSWGRPLSGICGIIALLAALGLIAISLGVRVTDPGEKYRVRYDRIQTVKYEKFADEIRAKVCVDENGAEITPKVLFIAYLEPETEDSSLERLRANLDNYVDVVDVIYIEGYYEEYFGEGEDGVDSEFTIDRTGKTIVKEWSAEVFNKEITNNRKYKHVEAIISVVGLPYNLQDLEIFEEKKSKKTKRPKIVLDNGDYRPLKEYFEKDMVHLCIADKGREHRGYGHEDDLPETDDDVFNGRFFFIRPDNVNEVASKYPKLFKASKKK